MALHPPTTDHRRYRSAALYRPPTTDQRQLQTTDSSRRVFPSPDAADKKRIARIECLEVFADIAVGDWGQLESFASDLGHT